MPEPAPFFRTVWSRRDVQWAVCLVLPPLAYQLVVKVQRASERALDLRGLEFATWVLSDVLAQLVWLCVALAVSAGFRARGRRLGLRLVLQLCVLVHAAVMLGSYGYFGSTGASLDYPTLAFALEHIEDSRKVIASASSPSRWAAFGSVVAGVVLLPWFFGRLRAAASAPRSSDRALGVLSSLSLGLVAYVGAQAPLFRGGDDLARDPLMQVLYTARERLDEEDTPAIVLRAQNHPRGPSSLERRVNAPPPKNLVIVLLESTGAWATSLYGGQYRTTPFLAELAEKSLVAEWAYAVLPHTSKAVLATLCGLEPRPGVEMVEALEGGIPGKCLATLLREQGYETMMMQAASSEFEGRKLLVKNIGFEQFIPGEAMDARGLAVANYFGYEDRILLEPTRRFLARTDRQKPFFLAYLTNTPHHDYLAPKSYGFERFTGSTMKNRYLNTVRYEDSWLKDLFAEFERSGALANTVFVILGDHGDGFGEHGLNGHDNIMYDECLRIPLLIYDGSRGLPAQRMKGPFSQLDIAPTVLELLGFGFDASKYSGRSMLHKRGKRTLYFACLADKKCVARLDGFEKLIHHFGKKPDELYDLANDPRERRNLAKKRRGDVQKARADAVAWYRTIRAVYRPALERSDSEFIKDKPPRIDHPLRVRFGDSIEYLGWSVSKEPVKPGDWITITHYFHVLRPPPPGATLFMYAEDTHKRHRWTHLPLHRMHPVSRWRAGEYLIDPHRQKVSSKWVSEVVTVRGGFETSRGRLEADPPADHDAPVLAEIPIVGRTKSAKPRTASASQRP